MKRENNWRMIWIIAAILLIGGLFKGDWFVIIFSVVFCGFGIPGYREDKKRRGNTKASFREVHKEIYFAWIFAVVAAVRLDEYAADQGRWELELAAGLIGVVGVLGVLIGFFMDVEGSPVASNAPTLTELKTELASNLMEHGPQSEQVADSYFQIGRAFCYEDDFQRALEAHQKGLSAIIAVRGPVHDDVAHHLDYIADAYYNLSDTEAYLEVMEKQVEIYLELYGPHYEELGYLYSSIGEQQSSLENYEAALKARKKHLEIWAELSKKGRAPYKVRVEIWGGQLATGEIYLKMGDVEAAKSLFIAMEETAMESGDRDENTLARLLSQQASVLIAGGQPELALERLQRALQSGLLDYDLKAKMKARVQALQGS